MISTFASLSPSRFVLAVSLACSLGACANTEVTSTDGGPAADALGADGDVDIADAGSAPTSDSGPPGATCALDACGGDVVGVWEFETPCLPARPAPVDECGSGQHFFVTRVDGTLELRADGTDTVTTRLVQETHSYLPARCIPGAGACESFFHGYDRCEVRDGFCDCALVTAPALEPAEETYRVEGSTLVFIDAAGTEQAVTFCVDGERLRYHHEGDRRPETLRRR